MVPDSTYPFTPGLSLSFKEFQCVTQTVFRPDDTHRTNDQSTRMGVSSSGVD